MKKFLAITAIALMCHGSTIWAQENYGFQLVGRALPGEANAAFVLGNRAYVGAGNSLQIYDVTNSSAPSLLGQLSLEGIAEDVFIVNNIAYIADGLGGLVISDISSPSNIVPLGQLPIDDEAQGICIVGNYAYTAGLNGGFYIVDISNPALPTQVGSFPVEWAALNVDVLGSLACVACGYGGLYILDISNPATPFQMGLVDTQDTWAYDVKINGEYAYMGYSLADGGGGLKVINISNPSAPQVAGNLTLSSELRRIDRSGAYVIGSAGDSGMLIIDTATPSNPHVVGGWQHGYGKNVFYANSKIYLAAGQEGLRIFNAPDLHFPLLASITPTYSASQDVAVAGNYAYVVEQPSGLKVINISNPAAPQVTFSHQFYLENGRYRGVSSGVSIVDGRLYVSDFADLEGGQHDFRAYGLNNPAQPESLGIFSNLNSGVRGHRVRNDIAYLSNSWALKILDVRYPDNMQLVNTIDGDWDFAYGMDLVGNYIYLGTMLTGLRIFDLTNEALPAQVGSFDTPGETFTAKYHNGYAYLPDYNYGLRIVNVENPATPYEVSYFNSFQYCLDVAFIDGPAASYAIVDFDDQIVALDITDPANPTEVGYYYTGDPRRLCTRGDTIYVADRMSGLYLFVLDAAVGIGEAQGDGIPNQIFSARNYPNPFNPSTTIEFVMPAKGWASLVIYDILGREIAQPLNGNAQSGTNRVIWDGTDSNGRPMSAGVYFYKLSIAANSIIGRMNLIK